MGLFENRVSQFQWIIIFPFFLGDFCEYPPFLRQTRMIPKQPLPSPIAGLGLRPAELHRLDSLMEEAVSLGIDEKAHLAADRNPLDITGHDEKMRS
jgi:hypothetical protein